MAATVQLPLETLRLIAEQVSVFWHAAGFPQPTEGRTELGETFQIWMMTGNAVVSGASLAEAVPTGRFHHQIYRDGQPDAHAYSRPMGPGASDWRLTAVFQSDAAVAINAAVDVVDGAFHGEGQARLLVIPSYDVQCVWVITGKTNRLVPAVVPHAYREAVVPLSVYDEHEFLASLRRYPYAQGVVP